MSIFTQIKNFIKFNLMKENGNGLESPNWTMELKHYNSNAFYWCTRQGAFKVDVKIKQDEKEKVYLVTLKDINLDSPFLKDLKRYTIRQNELMSFYDEFRQEDIGNYTSEHLTGFEAYYNSLKYEKLDKKDSCTYELYIQSLGFDNYEQYMLFIEKYPNLLDEEDFDNFLNQTRVEEYEI